MSVMRKSNEQEVTIDRPMAEVFDAFHAAGVRAGGVKQSMPGMGAMVVKTSMGLTSNSATVRISMESVSDIRTKVRFQSESLDGLVGFGSAGKAIDGLIREAHQILYSGTAPAAKANHVPMLFIVAFAVAVALAAVLLSIG